MHHVESLTFKLKLSICVNDTHTHNTKPEEALELIDRTGKARAAFQEEI